MQMKQAYLKQPKELMIMDIPVPTLSDGEILVRNVVSTTCGTDVKNYLRGYPLIEGGQPYGHEFSGVVEAVGENIVGFSVGDRVVAHNTAPCNRCYYCKQGQQSMCDHLVFNRGAYADYVKIPKEIVMQNTFKLPEEMTHKTASLLEPFSCAVYGISQVEIEPGDTVVVNGCGPLGLMFVILGGLQGARVIATDLSEYKLEKAKQVGADIVINMKESDYETVVGYTPEGRGADVVIEATGQIPVWEASLQMVRKGGEVLLFGGTKKDSTFTVDANLLHYSQISIKGIFHTTPKYVEKAFSLLKMGVLDEDVFIQNEYQLDNLEEAILEHSSGHVIKNCIMYDEMA